MDTPFTAHGDEAIEARIVAWVLGEASAFEAAELDRLCDERPELMVFKRRMLALHKMLAEAQNSQADESWKIPAEKRGVWEPGGVLGAEKPALMEAAAGKNIHRGGRRVLLAFAACLVFTVVVVGLIAPADILKSNKRSIQRTAELEAISPEPLASSQPVQMQRLEATIFPRLLEGAPNPSIPASLSAPVPAPAESASRSLAGSNDQRVSVAEPSSKRSGTKAGAWNGNEATHMQEFAANESASGHAEGYEAVPGHGRRSGKLKKSSPHLQSGSDDHDGRYRIAMAEDEVSQNRERGDITHDEPEDQAAGDSSPAQNMESSGANTFSRAKGASSGPLGNGDERSRFARAAASEMKCAPEDPAAGKADVGARRYAAETVPMSSSGLSESDSDDGTKTAEAEKQNTGLESKLQGAEGEQKTSKLDLTKLFEEIPASEEPCSTFPLNISDASFQVAQAALAKGERPDPAGIKVEQFYNVVDYGDPAPSAGEPVSCVIEQATHPVIPGRNLVRIALKTAAAGRSASQPLRLTLLVDQSGSMVREDRRAVMNKAFSGLSELLTANDIVTVIGFSRTPRLLVDGMTGDKAGKLADLINIEAGEGGSNLQEAIKLAERIAIRRKLAGAQNRIVLFTDGAADPGNADASRLVEQVKQLRQKGIAFDVAGSAADDMNDELLDELARHGNGRRYVVGKGGDDDLAQRLAGAFLPAAENMKVQVRFNPERVGCYKLMGFDKERLKAGDLRNDKEETAGHAAEEEGVAIYQIELLPEGHGEIGEVSVRFHDSTSNQLAERAWTIPQVAAAPDIDRATTSMQLATLCMLAGEKLKGGPLAEAIDFRRFADAAANVNRSYGDSGRVADMLRVVDALK